MSGNAGVLPAYRIARLELGDTDVLVIKVDQRLSTEQGEKLREYVSGYLPTVPKDRMMLLDAGMEVEVLHQRSEGEELAQLALQETFHLFAGDEALRSAQDQLWGLIQQAVSINASERGGF